MFDGKKYKLCMSKVIRTILYFGVGLYLIATGFLFPFSLTNYTMWWMFIVNIILGTILSYSLGIITKDW